MSAATFTLHTRSPAETFAFGSRLGRLLTTGQIITLRGELGAGKTTLTQGIAAGLGIKGHITSPTFTLINEYRGSRGLRLTHIDLYRLGDSAAQAMREASTIGLEEILEDAQDTAAGRIVIIEWAERAAPLLPPDHLEVALRYGDDETDRILDLAAHGPRSTALLTALSSE